ncbi:MAG: hypothetical protein VB035_05490 [Candidatus Fimivivens sp.]|nr:hypothetical protein [Candidatus Fimivivens sp.]
MKVEYSYYGNMPSLVIKGTDFIKALKDEEEYNLLEIAVKGFCARFDTVSHFDDNVNNAIKQWIEKSGNVIYSIKERWAGRTLLDTWCEVYVLNGTRLVEIVVSNNYGRNFSLNNKREVATDE